MSLLEQINKSLVEAMKTKDETKVSVLRMLKSQIKNKEIELKKSLTDDEILDVIAKQIKQRNDSITEFQKGNRNDLIEKEQTEIEILKPYLPEQLNDEEIKKVVDEVIAATGANSAADMGKVMKEVITKTKGKADNSKIAQMVKSQLQ